MSLLLSIANAAAEAVPGLTRYSTPGGGTAASSAHAPGSRNRGGWRERRQSFHSAGAGRSSAFYSPFISSRSGGGASLGGVYRLRWYRRPLRSQQSLPSSTSHGPPSTRSDLVTFSRRPRSSFPLSVGESVGESVGGGNGDDDSDDSTGGLTPTASPTASPSRDVGAGDSEGSDRRRRRESGSDGRQSSEMRRLSVSMHSTPDPLRIPSSEDEEEEMGGSTGQMVVSAPLSLTVEAAPTPEKPDRPLAPLSRRLRERESPPSARHAARGDAAAPRTERESVLPAPPMENAPTAPVMETIQRSEDGYDGEGHDHDENAGGGNCGGDDRDGGCGNISISPDGDSDLHEEYENSPASTVRLLRAEVERLKREMAVMAAAAAAANCAYRRSNHSGKVNTGDGDGVEPPKSPRAVPTGPVPWSWTTVENGDVGGGGGSGDRGGGSSDDGPASALTPSSSAAGAAAAVANATRPKSVRLRADDSWLQRGFSRETNTSPRRKSQLPQSPVSTIDGDASTTLGTPVSVAAPHMDDLNNSADVDAGAGEEAQPVTLLSPPARRHRNSVALGPSPASGEKNMGDTSGGDGSGGDRREASASIPAAAVASAAIVLDADEARDQDKMRPSTVGAAAGAAATGVGSGRRSCASRGSRGSSSGHRDITVRPCPVFFPPGGAQEDDTNAKPQAVPAQAPAPARGATPEVETTASDAKYLATELASAATTAVTGAAPVAPAAGVGGVSAAVNESSVAGADGGGGGSVRRRRNFGEGDRQLWRWVLAQRTENRTVRGALISHGLPQNERRRIWTAWATVARSNTTAPAVMDRRKNMDPKLGPVVNIISHDVQRTKLGHPLFTGESPQGIPILKRVLLRCAELGAVKDAGYIQGMNFLAGFLILIVAESVVSERDGVDATAAASESNTRLSGAGRATGGKQDNAASVNQQQERPAVGERGGNSAGGGGGGDEELSGSRRSSGGAGGGGSRSGGFGQDVKLTADEVAIVENECVEVLLGIVSLQGGVLSRDLHGLHANTELVEDLLLKHCPSIMDHLRQLNLELIVLTPRWFICIYAASIASQPVLTRIWDLFLWHGRRGPAVLVWVALGILHGARRRLLESQTLSTAVAAVRRYVEGCKTFADLIRQVPVGLDQVVVAWEQHKNNRRIVALDGEGPIPNAVVGDLLHEMTGEVMISLPPPPEDIASPRHRKSHSIGLPGLGAHFASTPGGRLPTTPLTSPRSPFPQWATNIFRSSTGGLPDEAPTAITPDRLGGGSGGLMRDSNNHGGYRDGGADERRHNLVHQHHSINGDDGDSRYGANRPGSPRADGGYVPGRWGDDGGSGSSSGARAGYRRASSTSWW